MEISASPDPVERDFRIKLVEEKMRFLHWYGLCCFALCFIVVVASIVMAWNGKQMPREIPYLVIGGTVVFGIVSLLFVAQVLRQPIALGARVSKEGGALDVTIAGE